jgi:hypothetical protein
MRQDDISDPGSTVGEREDLQAHLMPFVCQRRRVSLSVGIGPEARLYIDSRTSRRGDAYGHYHEAR